jgi:hypothetical protein
LRSTSHVLRGESLEAITIARWASRLVGTFWAHLVSIEINSGESQLMSFRSSGTVWLRDQHPKTGSIPGSSTKTAAQSHFLASTHAHQHHINICWFPLSAVPACLRAGGEVSRPSAHPRPRPVSIWAAPPRLTAPPVQGGSSGGLRCSVTTRRRLRPRSSWCVPAAS